MAQGKRYGVLNVMPPLFFPARTRYRGWETEVNEVFDAENAVKNLIYYLGGRQLFFLFGQTFMRTP